MNNMAATMAAAPRSGGTCDPDEFQLPVPGLFADIELGRGSMQLPDDFKLGASLAKLLILRDWQRALLRYRHEALQQFERELGGGQPHLNGADRLGLLRSTCDALRIDLPSEFGAVAAAET